MIQTTKTLDWDKYLKELDAYGLQDYLAIFQKYLDAFYENETAE